MPCSANAVTGAVVLLLGVVMLVLLVMSMASPSSSSSSSACASRDADSKKELRDTGYAPNMFPANANRGGELDNVQNHGQTGDGQVVNDDGAFTHRNLARGMPTTGVPAFSSPIVNQRPNSLRDRLDTTIRARSGKAIASPFQAGQPLQRGMDGAQAANDWSVSADARKIRR